MDFALSLNKVDLRYDPSEERVGAYDNAPSTGDVSSSLEDGSGGTLESVSRYGTETEDFSIAVNPFHRRFAEGTGIDDPSAQREKDGGLLDEEWIQAFESNGGGSCVDGEKEELDSCSAWTDNYLCGSSLQVTTGMRMFSSSKKKNKETEVALPNYYDDWKSLFPSLSILKDMASDILIEAMSIPQWVPWPEDHFADDVNVSPTDWTVFPFLHTFPATDESKMCWLSSTCSHCPVTTSLLRQIPNIRTALFSRLGPGTKLTLHTGWEDLANHVLRCHLALKVPKTGSCGLCVCDEIRIHQEGKIIVFDDSKSHKAFNESCEDRIVLIVDILRPGHISKGRAKGGHTKELDSFISQFR